LDVYQRVFLVTCDDRMSGSLTVVDVDEPRSTLASDTELILLINVFDVVRNQYRDGFTLTYCIK
jgi:hypothetical protein